MRITHITARHDGALLAVASFALCMALASPSFYVDGAYLHDAVERGAMKWQNHVLLLPCMRAFWLCVRPIGLDLFVALTLLSALSVSCTVFLAHRAAALLAMTRPTRFAFALLVGSTPVVLLHGTVIANYGVFFLAIGCVFWRLAAYFARPNARSALLLGAASGVASGIHASGHLAGGLFLCVIVAERGLSHALLRHALVAVLPHTLVVVMAAWLLQAEPASQALFTHGLVDSRLLSWPGLSTIRRVAWTEWWVPMFPLCLVPFAAVFVRSLRSLALVTLAACLVFQAIAFHMQRVVAANGAYMLSLVLPCALLVSRWLRPRFVCAIAALALLFAVPYTLRTQERELATPRVEQVRALAGGRHIGVIAASAADGIAFRSYEPGCPLLWTGDLAGKQRPPAAIAADFDRAHAAMTALGGDLWMTSRAVWQLESAAEDWIGEFWRGHVLAQYRLEALVIGSVKVLRIAPVR